MEGSKQKLLKYAKYLNLSEKQRKKIVDQAQQEVNKSHNPQGNHIFPIKDQIELKVADEQGKIIKLATFRYPAKQKPIAIVLMFHGLNSHIGHGAHIAHYFSENNIETVGFDHRGFGQSSGTPGYVKNLQSHIGDCLKWIEIIKKIYPNLPLFCLGLSMGGLASYYLTLTHQHLFQGAILMAPALKNQVGGFLVKTSKVLKALLPQYTKLIPPIYGTASRNPGITDFVKSDPHSYKGRVNLATTAFLVSTMDQSPQTFKNYKCPFLIIQGGADKFVNPMVAFELFEKSSTPEQDKDIIFYQHMWHDIWHEVQILDITKQIINWIHKRVNLSNNKYQNNN